MKLPLLTLGRTGFVTLLMIGIAMGQEIITTSSGATGSITITDLNEIDPTITCPIGYSLIAKGDDRWKCRYGDWGTTATWPLDMHAKPAKPPAKKAAPKPFKCDPTKLQSCASQANDDYGPGMRGLVGEIDWSAPASKYLKAAPPPTDVPAIRKTVKDEPNCSRSYIAPAPNGGWIMGRNWDGTICGDKPTFHQEWHCVDDDEYSLQVSVSRKAANCHRIAP